MAKLFEAAGEARKIRVAVVDDDESLNRSLVLHLQDAGLEVDSYLAGGEALAALISDPTDLVLLDIRLKDADGIDVLQRLRQAHPGICVVMITAFHETALTVEASKLGAFDYLPKPLNLDRLDAIIARALARRAAASEARAGDLCGPAAAAGPESGLDDQVLIGTSPAMLGVLKTIGTVARSGATVLVLGESGTGKELVARRIHSHSQRRGAFLSVNCATLTAELLSSELFGHERGAFTGAVSRRQGTFELADGGTLLLDEVSEMDLALQAKLLRVLQEREFRRLGGSATIRVDVRVVAATNRDLTAMVAQGSFRSDLYFRLAVMPIFLPPLRERPEDLRPLVEHFLHRLNRSSGQSLAISGEAMERLRRHPWPGNVRELQNVILRGGLEAKGPLILAEDLILSSGGAGPPVASEQDEDDLRSLKELERDHIASVLRHTGGKKSEAARILGISRPTLDSKLKRYKLQVGRTVEER